MRYRLLHLSLLLALLSTGCTETKSRARAIGEAFIGPISVDLRDDLAPAAKVIATVHHGDRVDILQARRRFVKLRTASGKEGWTDTRKLLSTEQMQQLRELAERAAKIPSAGQATPFDVLNMHAEPNRYSASFYQVTPGTQVEALLHRVTERTPPPPAEPIVKRPPPASKKKSKEDSKQPRVPPPPMPPAPALPSNWMELSKTDLPDEPDDDKDDVPAPPKKFDDWTLVRTKDGKAGWVLSRNVVMTIPDEVAQYSEGARITSYFPLAEVEDEELGVKKRHWLWTTLKGTNEPYDFDSFRVFIWNKRRHRYETSYIERKLEGYHPVRVEGPKFTVLLKNDQGGFYTKTFVLEGYLTRWLGNAPANAPPDALAGLFIPKQPTRMEVQPPVPEQKSLKDRVKERLARIFHH